MPIARLRPPLHGFTLIEMLVGLALSLVLTGATLSILISTRQSWQAKENLSRIQENLRLATDVMRGEIQQASAVLVRGPGATPAWSHAGQLVLSRRVASAGYDCEGDSVAAGATLYTRLYVKSGTQTLYCKSGPDLDSVAAASPPGEPLVDTVSGLVLSYGLDALAPAGGGPGDHDGIVDGPFVSAPSAGKAERIIGVQVRLTLAVEAPDAPQPQTLSFTAALRPAVIDHIQWPAGAGR